jgi:SNF2 family DNA or RNA helicase
MSNSRVQIIKPDSNRARVPLASDTLSLMPHQEAMVHKCMVIENASDLRARDSGIPGEAREPSYGVMCDPPGAGKTFAVIALILQEVQLKRSVMRRMGLKPENMPEGNDQNIIVVPFNIYTQWEECIRDCCGDEVRFKSFVNYQDISSLFFSTEVLKTNDILLTTSLYYANIASTMASMKLRVRRVIFDEIDSIAPLLNIPITCDHIWFVSASFEYKKLGEFKRKIEKRALELCTVQCDEDFINDCITLPPPIYTTIVCFNRYVDNVMHGLLNSGDMQLANARNFSQIRGQYVLKVAEDERDLLRNIREDKLCAIQKMTEQTQELADRRRFYGLTEEEEQRERGVRNELTRATQFLDVLSTRLDANGICQESMELLAGVKPDATPNKVTQLFQIVDRRVTEEEDFRMILFSDHPPVFSSVRKELETRGIVSKELDGGNIGEMDAILTKYKQGNVQVIMVDSSMYGCGMNLENTTDIAFMHVIPESRREQVVGRAQRYGRLGKLNVWNMLHENETETAEKKEKRRPI